MILATILSFAIGASLGLLGGGGSILTVPILVYALGLEPKTAIATSLLVVAGTSAAGALAHARAGRVDGKMGALFGATSMVGAYLGGRIASFASSAALLFGFTLVMIVTAVMMMRGRRGSVAGTRRSLPVIAVIGVAIGALTGLVGAGGGFVVVPALVLLCALPIGRAVGTSLLVIAMNSLAGFAGQVGHAHVDARVALVVTAVAIVGTLSGVALSGRVRPDTLRVAFGVFILAMSIFMITRQLPQLVALLHDTRVTHGLAALFGALAASIVLYARRAEPRLLEGTSLLLRPKAQ